MTISRQCAVGLPGFMITREYQRFVEFCDACRRYRYIGLCYRVPGVGKTLSARQYARWDLVEPVVAHDYDEDDGLPHELTNCRTVVYTPTIATTPKQLGLEVQALCRGLSWAVERLKYPGEGNYHR